MGGGACGPQKPEFVVVLEGEQEINPIGARGK
jgi:hypothetical protein